MYNTDYLAALFNVSHTTIRVYLRQLGLGVGVNGTYEFAEDEIDAVVNELAGLLKRDPSTPMARGGLVSSGGDGIPLTLAHGEIFISASRGNEPSEALLAALNAPSVSGNIGAPVLGRAQRVRNFAIDNKTSILYLVIGLVAAITGIDLAL